MAEADDISGVIEEDVLRLVEAIYQESADKGERAAANILVMAKKGEEERRAFVDAGVIPALCSMCTRENEARTQAKAALALGALCSNYAITLDDNQIYVHQEAQSEALSQGAVTLLVPVLTSWQPDAQAAAAEALANLAFQNSDARKQMQTSEAGKALVNLLHSENVDVHRAVLCALRVYAVEGRYALEIDSRGCLPPTIKLLNSDRHDVVARSLRLLWVLSITDPIKAKIAKEKEGKLLKEVVKHLRSTQHPIKAAAMQLVRTICTVEDYRAEVFALGGHTDVIAMISNKDDELLVLNALGCLTMMCSVESRKNAIASVNDIMESVSRLRTTSKGGKKASQAVQDRAKGLLDILGGA
mmetsp:Transcript_36732/g.90406  ORF Transcript_36732/g.90406 Transcript_36732/m.90406 type:complete len:358 (+) Transcript_36732:437-1510(+)|eukprot:CAMPEP_0206213984 /NCGR_PEP_ID=MMETSP0047_2-20121206/1421_1 /ASSEMBLY_ACC=CAM_ASM_000192 /TAXON_ID=195065 /ORGANISM="Chroomonas mesostigmatica_cf, Strain CCMP1168" /LENGTH=357 /DNA_ID=CAMNT_0053636185 /DNA_START=329 /DNA_END=1402 /DNA_ORIENTATION=-